MAIKREMKMPMKRRQGFEGEKVRKSTARLAKNIARTSSPTISKAKKAVSGAVRASNTAMISTLQKKFEKNPSLKKRKVNTSLRGH